MQVQRGGARAAVLGVNDGLVSVLCIVLAVAGAHASRPDVLLAGFAGLVAGAISMAVGEWISVTSQVDLYKGILGDLRRLVADDRDLLIDQLQTGLVASGLSAKTAATAAIEIGRDDEALATEYAKHVMEINPNELGSPWTVASSSFALFVAGAVVSLIPWFFIGGLPAVITSIVTTSIGGLIVGGYVGQTSGNSVLRGALRQFVIIAFASFITYGVGNMFGGLTR